MREVNVAPLTIVKITIKPKKRKFVVRTTEGKKVRVSCIYIDNAWSLKVICQDIMAKRVKDNVFGSAMYNLHQIHGIDWHQSERIAMLVDYMLALQTTDQQQA